jgi:hypothetical protein
VKKGEFKPAPPSRPSRTRSTSRTPLTAGEAHAPALAAHSLPEDLLEMDSKEFRRVLSQVIRDELGVGHVALAGKWQGGEVVLKPGREGVAEKHVPIDSLFHKIVMIRDRLRVLEQRLNSHSKLADDEKVQLQQYITACYGSLTTFNVLFADRDDQFVGQKGEE